MISAHQSSRHSVFQETALPGACAGIGCLSFFPVEEEGIKITGLYPYEVYVQILEEMLQQKPDAAQPPSLEQFLQQYKMVASKEVAVVYDMTVPQAEKELKKLMLKQIVEQIPAKYGMFWRYLEG